MPQNLTDLLEPYKASAPTTGDQIKPVPSGERLLSELRSARALAGTREDADALRQAASVLEQWMERDAESAARLSCAPAPSIPCPNWCGLEPEHWWDHDDGPSDDVQLTRWHERDLSPEPDEVDGDFATIRLERMDKVEVASGDQYVLSASRVSVDVHGDGGGASSLTSTQARAVVAAIAEAADLLDAGAAAGDPAMGRADFEWRGRRDRTA